MSIRVPSFGEIHPELLSYPSHRYFTT